MWAVIFGLVWLVFDILLEKKIESKVLSFFLAGILTLLAISFYAYILEPLSRLY